MPRKRLPPKAVEPSVSIFDRIDNSARDPNFGTPLVKRTGYLGIYDLRTVNGICDRHKIQEAAQREHLFHSLEFQAVQYRHQSERGKSKATIPQIRGQLRELVTALERAAVQIDGVHPSTMQNLLKAEKEFYMPPPEVNLQPLIAVGASMQTGPEEWKTMSFGDTLPHLKLLSLVAQKALSKLPRTSGGRPVNLPLFAWVSSLAQFWMNGLKRRFTIDTKDGEGLTPSYMFLADCLRPLAPRQLGHLPSMMRRVRTDMNRSRKGSS